MSDVGILEFRIRKEEKQYCGDVEKFGNDGETDMYKKIPVLRN